MTQLDREQSVGNDGNGRKCQQANLINDKKLKETSTQKKNSFAIQFLTIYQVVTLVNEGTFVCELEG